MSVKPAAEKEFCIHLEKRVIERVSRGIPMDMSPDLVLRVCHFPLPSLTGIQCRVALDGTPCPHSGPYGNN